MLKAIEITNFKGVGDTIHIPIRPITLMFGANSSGKSTILHALQFAYEVLVHQNLDADITERGGHALNLGGFQNFVHNRDLNKKVTIAFDLDLQEAEDIAYFFPERNEDSNGELDSDLSAHIKTAKVSFSIGWNSLEKRPQITQYSVDLNGQFSAALNQDVGRKTVSLSYNLKHPLALVLWSKDDVESFTDSYEDIDIGNLYTALPIWGRALEYIKREEYDYLPGGEYVISQILVGVGQLFVDYLKRLRHIGPIREIISRNYEAVTSRIEGRWFEGKAAWDYLLTKATDDEIDLVGKWLGDEDKLHTGYRIIKERYKEKHSLEDNSLYSGPLAGANGSHTAITLQSVHDDQKFRLFDVGIGMSQLVPVVVASLLRSTKILAVEQPELHIHPSIQVGLGDLFASQIIDRECLFIIETHSEHLILRLLRRIQEHNEEKLPLGAPKVNNEDISIVFFENTSQGMSVTPIGVDQKGEFTRRWPKGFFDERVGELF